MVVAAVLPLLGRLLLVLLGGCGDGPWREIVVGVIKTSDDGSPSSSSASQSLALLERWVSIRLCIRYR